MVWGAVMLDISSATGGQVGAKWDVQPNAQLLALRSVQEPSFWAGMAAQRLCLWSSFTRRPGCGSEHCCAMASLPGLSSKGMVPWLGAAALASFLLANFMGSSAVQRAPNQHPFEVQVFIIVTFG